MTKHRTRNRTATVLILAAVAIFGVLDAASAVNITNPNFDPPDEDVSNNPSPGYGPISNWGFSGAGASGINPSSTGPAPFLNGLAPHSGTHVAFIQNGGPGAITQTLSGFDPSKDYTVTYFVNERGNGASPATSTSVSLDGGTTSFSVPGNIVRTDAFRRVVSGPLSVSVASPTLNINATGVSGDNTLLVDTVSVTRAVPVTGDLGFENPVQPAGTWKQQNGAGAGTLVGSVWTFVNGGGITDNGSAFGPPAAPEGSQAAILQNAGSSFSQTISGFEAGVSYSLSFEAAGRATQAGPNDFSVLLDGTALSFGGATSITPTAGSYNLFTSDIFTTAGGSFSLEFRGLGQPDRTSFVDDIRFNFVAEAVPEPSTLGLAALALLSIGFVGWRRRRR